jgi:molybdopterin-guanine dinucleotide biosynthesis protein A
VSAARVAYILAGGRSSRFGSDKARALFDGVSLIQRTAGALGALGFTVTVVADVAGKYADLGLRTIADREPDQGPLAGLSAALVDAASNGQSWVLLASCDLLNLKAAWIETLWQAAIEPAEFVAFRGEFWEPLLACYHVSLRPRIDQRLGDKQGSMWKLLEASHGQVLPLPADWSQVQANTPAELAAAEAALRASQMNR